MSDRAHIPSVDSIVELTRQVSALAEQGNWVRAAELNAERQMQLDAFCAALDPSGTPVETIETLTRILRLNDELIGSVQHRQHLLLQEAASVRTGRRAVAAYGL